MHRARVIDDASTGRGRPRRRLGEGILRRVVGPVLGVALAGSFATAFSGGVAAAGATPPRSALATVLLKPNLSRAGDRPVGLVPAQKTITGDIALKPRDPGSLSRFITDVSSPHSPLFHHYLAKGQFAKRFGPTAATLDAVRSEVRAAGLSVTHLSANHLLLGFRASAATVESVFHTGLERVALAQGGIGRATTTVARLPRLLASHVEAVLGLDNLVRQHGAPMRGTLLGHPVPGSTPQAAPGGPVACTNGNFSSLSDFGALTDEQVAQVYGIAPLYKAGDLAAGQTIDVIEFEPFLLSDIRQFDSCYFGKAAAASHVARVHVINVDGGPGTGAGVGEAALDVEDLSAIAPDATIHVYQAPNTGNSMLDILNQIAVNDDAHQISLSWGDCETELQQLAPGAQEVENNILEQAAAQGQSLFADAGDDGSDDCAGHATTATPTNLSVEDPGSNPYAVSVGGTTIYNATTPPVEGVWNNGNSGGAAGGGVSEVWAMPSWQMGFITKTEQQNEACSDDPQGTGDDEHLAGDPTNLPAGTPCREVPDVSALADPQSGITIVYSGQWIAIGGTSSSTPLWAAMTAEMNASNACGNGSDSLGFVSPLLYTVAAGADHASAFNDITFGNNDNLDVGNGTDYEATVGYDLASGLGTPRITNPDNEGLVNQMCALVAAKTPAPVVTGLSTPAGPVAGGNLVTITGKNFGTTEGNVYFGDVEAKVPSASDWTPTAVTVTVPPYTPPAETNPPSGTAVTGGAAVVTVSTSAAAGPIASSSPSEASTYHYTGGSSAKAGPIVDYVSADMGPQAGGDTVDIVGAGFAEGGGVSAVTFGGVPAKVDKVLNDNTVEVTVPAETGSTACATTTPGICQVEVVVTDSDGQSSPTVPILPGLSGSVTFNSAGVLLVPSGCGCEVSPVQTEYDYAPPPTITSVTPRYASEEGGNTITINGSGFNWLTIEWVNIGPAGENVAQDNDITSITATQIQVAANPDPNITRLTAAPQPTQISVQTSGGLASGPSFSYAGVPTVTGLSTHFGSQSNAAPLTITGKDFQDANLVVFQGQGDAAVISSSTAQFSVNAAGTSIRVNPPNFYSFPTDVLVCSVTACSNPNPAVDGYFFAYPGVPVVTSSSPRTGGEKGGTVVLIEGSLDGGIVSVNFGTQQATILDEPVASPSGPIEVLAPPSKKAGTVHITITTAGGYLAGHPTSAATNAATFTYHPSAPSAPQDLTVTPGVESLHASWRPPYANGGSKVTGYIATATASGARSIVVRTRATHVTFKGLKAGVGYTVKVVAVSKLGRGLAATSEKVKPSYP